jgi:hypothetical protein
MKRREQLQGRTGGGAFGETGDVIGCNRRKVTVTDFVVAHSWRGKL